MLVDLDHLRSRSSHTMSMMSCRRYLASLDNKPMPTTITYYYSLNFPPTPQKGGKSQIIIYDPEDKDKPYYGMLNWRRYPASLVNQLISPTSIAYGLICPPSSEKGGKSQIIIYDPEDKDKPYYGHDEL